MRLWMSGEIWHEIDEPFRVAMMEVEDAVNLWLAGRDYGAGLVKLAFIPMITPPGVGYANERKLLRRKLGNLECRLKLDYAAFASGTPPRQREMIVKGLLRCLEIARSKRIADFDADRLIRDFRAFAIEQSWLGQSKESPRVT